MQKTRSEAVFERWLDVHGLKWKPIQTDTVKTPDYAAKVTPDTEIIFEIKQIETARRWADDIVHGGEVGAFIRDRIKGSKSQIQPLARLGKPTVLVIFNAYDPIQLFGTEDHDFICAMYGAYTLQIETESRRIVDHFLGVGKSFQYKKNTSFSALARLKESGREATISMTLFKNIHAKVPIDYATLPPCFEVAPFEP